MPPAAARQNDYFVPRDGIDREVITSDICRYLGNDALVRPGTYEVLRDSQPVLRLRQFHFSPPRSPVVTGRPCHARLFHHSVSEPDISEYPSRPSFPGTPTLILRRP